MFGLSPRNEKRIRPCMYRIFITLVLLSLPLVTRADIRYLEILGADGVPLVVATAGNPANPPILFIHGIASSHFAFHRQLESSLADDYYLVAPDLRGHGGSGKPWEPAAYTSSTSWAGDVDAVLAATGSERPLVVAWSYGTLVALDYLRERGAAAVSGLVLTGAIGALKPFRSPAEDDPQVAEFQAARALLTSADPRDQVEASERILGWLTHTPLPAAEHRVMQSIAMMFPTYARQAIYTRAQDNRDLLPQLADVPILLALGAEENKLVLEDAAALARDYSNISLSRYTGAGHSVFLEQPEQFTAELRGFAASLPINRADESDIAASKK